MSSTPHICSANADVPLKCDCDNLNRIWWRRHRFTSPCFALRRNFERAPLHPKTWRKHVAAPFYKMYTLYDRCAAQAKDAERPLYFTSLGLVVSSARILVPNQNFLIGV